MRVTSSSASTCTLCGSVAGLGWQARGSVFGQRVKSNVICTTGPTPDSQAVSVLPSTARGAPAVLAEAETQARLARLRPTEIGVAVGATVSVGVGLGVAVQSGQVGPDGTAPAVCLRNVTSHSCTPGWSATPVNNPVARSEEPLSMNTLNLPIPTPRSNVPSEAGW